MNDVTSFMLPLSNLGPRHEAPPDTTCHSEKGLVIHSRITSIQSANIRSLHRFYEG